MQEKVNLIEKTGGWYLQLADDDEKEIIAGPYPTRDDAIIGATEMDLDPIVAAEKVIAAPSVLGSGRKVSQLQIGDLFRVKSDWFYLRGKAGKQATIQAVNNGQIVNIPSRTRVDAVSVLNLV